MTVERRVRALAGSMILVGLLLTWLVSPWFLLIPLFVGLNLFQSAFTGFCPAEKFLAPRTNTLKGGTNKANI
jgi:Inner membrane protein YgaP-like, transmembrane domain